MKLLKAKKGIKINSQEGDGHEDNSKCHILGMLTTDNEELQKVSDRMYMVVYEDDKYPIPILTTGNRIQITDDELEYFAFPDRYGYDYAINVAEQLEATGFKFYE